MKYNILNADPPWPYQQRRGRGCAEEHIEVMSVGDIACLDVPSICHDDCLLFLWATMPKLIEALYVLLAWDFQYLTVGPAWVKTIKSGKNKGKPRMGNGRWFRSNLEFCLVGKRGKPKRFDAGVNQIIMEPKSKFASKPIEAKDRIVRLAGDLPRLEMFAREVTPGWHAIGKELDGLDIRESISTVYYDQIVDGRVFPSACNPIERSEAEVLLTVTKNLLKTLKVPSVKQLARIVKGILTLWID